MAAAAPCRGANSLDELSATVHSNKPIALCTATHVAFGTATHGKRDDWIDRHHCDFQHDGLVPYGTTKRCVLGQLTNRFATLTFSFKEDIRSFSLRIFPPETSSEINPVRKLFVNLTFTGQGDTTKLLFEVFQKSFEEYERDSTRQNAHLIFDRELTLDQQTGYALGCNHPQAPIPPRLAFEIGKVTLQKTDQTVMTV